MEKNWKNIYIFISALLIMIMFAFLYFMKTSIGISNVPGGEIVLRINQSRTSNDGKLIVFLPDGTNIRYIGEFQGSPTFSPDGKLLAVGCQNQLCILSLANLPKNDDLLSFHAASRLYELDMPKECYSYYYFGSQDYSGINSISWSPDGEQLILVCGNARPPDLQSVCILSLSGENGCWSNENAQGVYRASWSPVDESIILTSGAKGYDSQTQIYITDVAGNKKDFIDEGESAEWSPKGDQITYISHKQESVGLYLFSMTDSSINKIDLPFYIYFDCNSYDVSCRISWSPDGRYLIFNSSHGSESSATYRLYRYDFESGEIIVIIDSFLYKYPAEADWGSLTLGVK
jgi:Tol biopolymer transport system component